MLILQEAAEDGVSLTYAADRLFDRLLETQNRVGIIEAENKRLLKELEDARKKSKTKARSSRGKSRKPASRSKEPAKPIDEFDEYFKD